MKFKQGGKILDPDIEYQQIRRAEKLQRKKDKEQWRKELERDRRREKEREYDSDSSVSSLESYDEREISEGNVGELIEDRYLIIKYLSYGTFSTIWLVYDAYLKDFKALKIQKPKYRSDAKDEARIMKKLQDGVGGCQSNKYITKLHDSFTHVGDDKKKYFCFIFELLGPDLFYYQEHFRFDSNTVKKITKELLTALDYMHSKGMIHTDIKLENVLTTNLNMNEKCTNTIKWFSEEFEKIKEELKEFDWTQIDKKDKKKRKKVRLSYCKKLQSLMKDKIKEYVDENADDSSDSESESDTDYESEDEPVDYEDNVVDSDHENNGHEEKDNNEKDDKGKEEDDRDIVTFEGEIRLSDFGGTCDDIEENPIECQTRDYRAPEVITEFYKTNTKMDIWSVGCLVYELLYGESLFDLDDKEDCDEEHLMECVKYFGQFSHGFIHDSDKGKELFDRKGRVRGYHNIERVNFLEMLDNNEELFDFLSQCFVYNPDKRASAKDLLQHPWLTIKEEKVI